MRWSERPRAPDGTGATRDVYPPFCEAWSAILRAYLLMGVRAIRRVLASMRSRPGGRVPPSRTALRR